MRGTDYSNDIRAGLAAGEFFVTVEFVTPEATEPFEAAVKPAHELGERLRGDHRAAGISITDRVRSDQDHDPVAVAARVAEASGKQPLVHLAGKDREVQDLLRNLERMKTLGLTNVLLVTGDRLKDKPLGRRVRYLESVPAIWTAKNVWSELTVAAAVSPFKDREEECLNQYLKLGKKLRAGADYIITQIGYHMRKFEELAWWCSWRGYKVPLVANLMPLTAPRGRYIRDHRVPGITITNSLQALIEEEAQAPDKGRERAFRRLALQIVGVKRLGYAGVQLTGVRTWEFLEEILAKVEDLEGGLGLGRWEDWRLAWRDALTFTDGRVAQVAPAESFHLFDKRPSILGDPAEGDPTVAAERRQLAPGAPRFEYWKYRWLDAVDRLVFVKDSPGARLFGPLLGRVRSDSALDRVLLAIEHAIKKRMVGCVACGECRLHYTFYVCPETCRKGLANGPCGGTRNNTCEFGDWECIHSAKYRIAKQAGALRELEEVLIPVVPAERRGSCSWTAHFRSQGPRVRRIELGEWREWDVSR